MVESFSATVSSWARAVPGVLEAIWKESTQRVIEDMLVPVGAGGNMPVDTGFLRASLLASTSAMPLMSRRGVEGQTYSPDAGQVSLVIAGAELGQTIYAGFTAVYARRVNYLGYLFVEKAAQKWPETVRAVEQELAARAGLQ